MLDFMTSESLSASPLLRSIATNERRPHLLLDCTPMEAQCIRLGVTQWGDRPVTHCRLPGPLTLSRHRGTLLLEGLHFMNLTQQLALYDWLTHNAGQVQVISLASRVIDSLVANGDFLEGLFFRLNVVRLEPRIYDAA